MVSPFRHKLLVHLHLILLLKELSGKKNPGINPGFLTIE
jgi:hypothetical protein